MPGGLKDLAQNIFRHPRVESAHVQRSLVRLWRGSTRERTAAARRHDTLIGRCNSGRDRVRVRRDMERRRRHVCGVSLAVLARIEAGGADVRLRGRRQLTACGGVVVGHDR